MQACHTLHLLEREIIHGLAFNVHLVSAIYDYLHVPDILALIACDSTQQQHRLSANSTLVLHMSNSSSVSSCIFERRTARILDAIWLQFTLFCQMIGCDAEQFKAEMVDNGLYLATWVPGDLDLYQCCHRFDTSLYKDESQCASKSYLGALATKITTRDSQYFQKHKEKSTPQDHRTTHINTFHFRDTFCQVQVIVVPCDPFKHVSTMYDFGFLMNTYDWKSLTIRHPLDVACRVNANESVAFPGQEERIRKYEKRGFDMCRVNVMGWDEE